jgi:tyrosine-protein kinase Etk/Wzc
MPMNTSPNNTDDLSLGDLLTLLWNGRWNILSAMAVTLVLAVFYTWRAIPIYQVDAMLQIESKKPVTKGNMALAAVTEGLFEVSSEAQAEVEIIKSNLVLGRAVDVLHLDLVATPKLTPIVGAALVRGRKDAPRLELESFDGPRSQYFRFLAGEAGAYEIQDLEGRTLAKGRVGDELTATWQGQPLKVKVQTLVGKPGQAFAVVRQPILAAIEQLRAQLTVEEKGKQTNILGLTFQDREPAQGAEILNVILDQYIRQNIERKAEEASKTLAFLSEQMPLLKGRLEVAEEHLNRFRSISGSADLGEEAKLVLKQSVDLEGQILALRQKRDELLRTYQERSDVVGTLDSQIAKLSTESTRLAAMVKTLPSTQQEIVRLMRDVQVDQDLYTSLMNNVQQLQVAKAGEIGNARIVDHATPGLKPIKPQRSTNIALGGILGILLGVSVVMMRRALHRGIEDPQALEGSLGLPVLVTIPHSDEQQDLAGRKGPIQLLGASHPEDMAIESLRSLRTSLRFTLVDSPNRVVMIAGPAPEIGKSFVSANFAFVLAQSGARVLLIDADLRKGKLHRHLGLEERKSGLSEVLAGQIEWRKALQLVHGFDLLTTGALPPNPAELLMNPRLETLLKEASEAYDFVLVDTPPVLAVTDAMIIGAYAGAVVMTLKAGVHTLVEIRVSLQRLESAGIKPKGIVFNDISRISGRYGYNRYAYQYRYTTKAK